MAAIELQARKPLTIALGGVQKNHWESREYLTWLFAGLSGICYNGVDM